MPDLIPMWRRYLRLFGADPRADVDDELDFHIHECADDLMASGFTRDEAFREAKRQLGDVAGIKRELGRVDKAGQRWERLRNWSRDLVFSLRRLRREPGFFAASVTTLTLGVGAAVAVFAVVDAVVFRPLPYPDSDRLVHLSPSQNFNMAFADALADASALEASTGLSKWGLTLTGIGEPVELTVQAVDADFFRVMRTQPVVGRAFRSEERDPGLSDIVILSHGLWQARFGSDRDVIGRRIDLDGSGHATRRVIGVMPRGFVPPMVGPEVTVSAWIPLSRAAGRTVATDSTWYVNDIVARLAPGASVEQAATEIRRITANLRREFPGRLEASRLETAGAVGLLDSIVGDVRASLWALLGGVGLVLVLVCVNLANLMLARGNRRRRELAIRAALGAGRVRLIREQLTDSLVLALLGGGGGVLAAHLLLNTLGIARTSSLPRTTGFVLDARVLAFALLVSCAAAIVFGLWPAIRASAGDVREDLGAGTRGSGMTRAGGRLGAILVAGEIALATILVTGAGLLLRSLEQLKSVEIGIDPSDVLVLELSPPSAQYQGEAARTLYDQIFERIRAIPGVATVGAIHLLPLTRNNWGFPFLAEGHPPPDGPLPSANFRVVTPDYFDTVDQLLLEGRMLTEDDRRTANLSVGLVNRKMADQLWPGASAVGKTIRLFGNQPFEVVGVVSDVRQFTLDIASVPEMYVPHGAGWSLASMVVMIESSTDPRSITAAARQAVWGIDANIPIVSVRGMDEIVGQSMARRRFFSNVLSFFGVLALTLGAVGVFGVMVYTMGTRRIEFGIRMALGATRRRVLGGAVSRGSIAIAAGLLIGLVGSTAASRLLESLLFEVSPEDPITRVAAGIILASVAAIATFIPAYRATRFDAATVMRAD